MDADLKRDLCKRYGYSVEYLHYWLANPTCEACGKQESALPYQIVTRGAGGNDDEDNLLALCFVCRGYYIEGWRKFIERHVDLADKVHARRFWEVP